MMLPPTVSVLWWSYSFYEIKNENIKKPSKLVQFSCKNFFTWGINWPNFSPESAKIIEKSFEMEFFFRLRQYGESDFNFGPFKSGKEPILFSSKHLFLFVEPEFNFCSSAKKKVLGHDWITTLKRRSLAGWLVISSSSILPPSSPSFQKENRI